MTPDSPTAAAHAALASALALCAAAPAQPPVPPDLKPKQLAQAAEQLRAELPDDALLAALHRLAARVHDEPAERTRLQRPKRPKKARDFEDDADALPQRVVYLFGVGTIVAADVADDARKASDKRRQQAVGDDAGALELAARGAAPDADVALAVLLRELDRDTAADEFAAFLHEWRNGDESFYEALDRTAGTDDSVFFFDVMLDDFRGRFARGEHRLRGGLQQAHDALHDAFLAYRQYRGFHEAVAWSLVLPPDLPLPHRLRRYEEKVAGSYSLRQQVTMAAAALDWDLDRLVASIRDAAPPLPSPVWSARYDPYPAWLATFTSLQERMVARAGSTDAFLAEALAERRGVADRLRQLLVRCVEHVHDGEAHAARH